MNELVSRFDENDEETTHNNNNNNPSDNNNVGVAVVPAVQHNNHAPVVARVPPTTTTTTTTRPIRKRRRRPLRSTTIARKLQAPPEWFADESAAIRIQPFFCNSSSGSSNSVLVHPKEDNDTSESRASKTPNPDVITVAPSSSSSWCIWLWKRERLGSRPQQQRRRRVAAAAAVSSAVPLRVVQQDPPLRLRGFSWLRNNNNDRQQQQRIIPFRALGTSAHTAILGLDRTGSYLVALSSTSTSSACTTAHNNNNHHHAALVLQLLAVPSPAALQQQQQQRSRRGGGVATSTTTASVPVWTVPLEYPRPSRSAFVWAVGDGSGAANQEDDPDHPWGWSSQPCPVQTAVRVWLRQRNHNGVGICVYRDTTATPMMTTTTTTTSSTRSAIRRPLVHAVVFRACPSPEDDDDKTEPIVFWRLYNVPAPSQAQLDDENPSKDCNLLWHVDYYPALASNHSAPVAVDQRENQGSWLCDSVVVGPALLFLMDEEDGYRLTWISDTGWNAKELPQRSVERLWTTTTTTTTITCTPPPETEGKKKRNSVVRSSSHAHIIVAPVTLEDSGWERCSSSNSKNNNAQDWIRATRDRNQRAGARLVNHPSLDLPCTAFFSVTALLHSILTRRPGLVQPPFDSSNGVKMPNYSYHFVGLTDGGRQAEILIVFSVGPVGQGCVGIFVELDWFTSDYREIEFIRHTAYDSPPSAACAHLALRKRHCQVDPKALVRTAKLEDIPERHHQPTMSMQQLLPLLYPDCETFDNVAVRRQTPVGSMQASAAPVEIVYG